MNKTATYSLLLGAIAILLILASCKKETPTDVVYNRITITDGVNSGYTYDFPVMMGFWSIVNESTKSYWVVFGDEVVPPNATSNVLEFFMYLYGQQNIIFPGSDGQSMLLTLNIEGTDCTYVLKTALFSVYEISDFELVGYLDGTFLDGCNNNEEVQITMECRIPLQQF